MMHPDIDVFFFLKSLIKKTLFTIVQRLITKREFLNIDYQRYRPSFKIVNRPFDAKLTKEQHTIR